MAGLNQVVVLFLLIVFGLLVKKLKFVSDNFQNEISRFIINVSLPAFIITSVSKSVNISMLTDIGKLLIIFIALFLVVIFISYATTKIFKIEGMDRDIFQFAMIFPNGAFIGFPIIKAVYGNVGVVYAAVFNLVFNILVWSFGVYLMKRNCDECSKDEDMTLRLRIKAILNPALVALFLGFGLSFLSIKIPSLLNDTLKMVGDTTSPLSMMSIGFILAGVHFKELAGSYKIYIFGVVKLIVFPMVCYLILKNFIENEMLGVAVLLTGMPTGVLTAIIASRYNNNSILASKLVFLTTLMSIVTLPLLIKFLIA